MATKPFDKLSIIRNESAYFQIAGLNLLRIHAFFRCQVKQRLDDLPSFCLEVRGVGSLICAEHGVKLRPHSFVCDALQTLRSISIKSVIQRPRHGDEQRAEPRCP